MTTQNPVTTRGEKSRIRTVFEDLLVPFKAKSRNDTLPSLGQIRAPTLKAFWDRMRTIDSIDALRSMHIKNVRSGRDTFHDLFRIDFSLNGRKAPLVEGGFRGILSRVPEAERESKFPRTELCEYMGMTEEQYKELDYNGYRRDAFYLLQSLFEDAKDRNPNENFHVPHTLLIEELVTTLNAGCVCGFPYGEIAEVTKDAIINMNAQGQLNGGNSALYKVKVTCTEPNKISVSATLRTSEWLSLGVETLLSYDVTVNDDKSISYENVHMTAVFQGMDQMYSNILLEEYRNNPAIAYSLQQDPPKTYPVKQGLILATPLQGKTFTAESMLSSSPQKAPSQVDTSAQHEAGKTTEDTVTPATQQKTTSNDKTREASRRSGKTLAGTILGKIRNFFVAVLRYIQGLLGLTKKSFGTPAANTVHEEKVSDNDRVQPTTPAISVTQCPAAERSTEKPPQHAQPNTAPALATGTDGMPSSLISSVHVGAAACSSGRSQSR